MTRYLIAATLAVAMAATGWARGRGCPQCGCGQCKKVCKLVCETKKETVWCYDCKCEDFCIPGKSCLLGSKCVPNTCDPCKTHREFCWAPSCGPVRQKMVLLKVPKTVEKTVYKCVVECVCCGCGCAKVDFDATKQLVENGNIEGIEFSQNQNAPLPANADLAETIIPGEYEQR